jgi:hypothetical protein
MKEGIFAKLFSLVKDLANVECTTTAGRVNILGMVLSLMLAISLSLAPIFETLVRLVHPNVSIGTPLVQIFIIFCVFTLICAGMLGYLEGPQGRSATRTKQKERTRTKKSSSSKNGSRAVERSHPGESSHPNGNSHPEESPSPVERSRPRKRSHPRKRSRAGQERRQLDGRSGAEDLLHSVATPPGHSDKQPEPTDASPGESKPGTT